MGKRYRMFVPEDKLDKMKEKEGQVLSELLIDEDTEEQFQAKVMISSSPKKGYHNLVLQGRGEFVAGDWYVKVLEREEEKEEAITVFESMRLGERRGYMLRSMMAEEKAELKKETMTTELQKRLKRKQEVVKEILKKEE